MPQRPSQLLQPQRCGRQVCRRCRDGGRRLQAHRRGLWLDHCYSAVIYAYSWCHDHRSLGPGGDVAYRCATLWWPPLYFERCPRRTTVCPSFLELVTISTNHANISIACLSILTLIGVVPTISPSMFRISSTCGTREKLEA